MRTVKSRVDGWLVKLSFQEGQFVREGDPVAEIDPRPFEVQLEQAEGQNGKGRSDPEKRPDRFEPVSR